MWQPFGEVETIKHILHDCGLYQHSRATIIHSIQKRVLGLSDSSISNMLLIGSNPQAIFPCTKFLATVYIICNDYINWGMNDF